MNIPQFRKNLREAFNAAENGEVVEIVRHGRIYHLVVTPFSLLSTDEVSSNIRPDIPPAEKAHYEKQKAEDDERDRLISAGIKKSSVATPQIESKLQEFQKEKKMKFCPNGHAIPEGRSKCMGKGCQYAK